MMIYMNNIPYRTTPTKVGKKIWNPFSQSTDKPVSHSVRNLAILNVYVFFVQFLLKHLFYFRFFIFYFFFTSRN